MLKYFTKFFEMRKTIEIFTVLNYKKSHELCSSRKNFGAELLKLHEAHYFVLQTKTRLHVLSKNYDINPIKTNN